MSPVGLGELLSKLPQAQDSNLLVGFHTSDDAGVYRLSADQAIISTADFITPPVDDPYIFGQIAAANALSDVYAMGGKPLMCINLVGFPSGDLEPEILHGIVEGALSKITEAGAVLGGGHTTDDEEPKFGLAVTGIVHPDRIWRNTGAKAGDALILTKPIGSGVLFNANLKKWVSESAMQGCIKTLIQLNKTAAEVLQDFEIHAVTDVTGFGLAGHSFEMAKGSGKLITIDLESLPILPEALQMYEKGMNTGVNLVNSQLVANHIRFTRSLPNWHREIVYDPQTSGGLLVALPQDQVKRAITSLHAAGVTAAVQIGKIDQLLEDNLFLKFD